LQVSLADDGMITRILRGDTPATSASGAKRFFPKPLDGVVSIQDIIDYEKWQKHNFDTGTTQPYVDFMNFLQKKLDAGYDSMKFQVTDFYEDCGGPFSSSDHPCTTNDYNIFPDEYAGKLDVTVFYNNVYFLKNGLSPSGVSIGSGQYISYNFAALSSAIGGFSGKTIEIQFGGVPSGSNTTYGVSALYFNDNLRIFKTS